MSLQNIHLQKSSGFTLIELLVVTGILVAISSIIGGILFSTLRGSETTRSTTLVAQNGNYAMTTFSETIKQSRQVTNVYTTLPVENFSDCTNSPSGTHITLRMPDNKEATLTCNYNNLQKIASSSAQRTYYLVEDSLRTKEDSCKFVCHQASAYSAPRIEIQFELGRTDSAGAIQEGTEKLFQTQINVRNFNNQ
jgi:prepilin-type N-terminal cleavage/methylation domain-containing protein